MIPAGACASLSPPEPSMQSQIFHLSYWIGFIHTSWIDLSLSSSCSRVSSSSSFVFSGISQGSFLGSLLFSYLHNRVTNIPINSSLIFYADDIDIFIFKPVDTSSNSSPSQSDLYSVSSLLSSNILTLNYTKSKYMFFMASTILDSLPPLYITSDSLQWVYPFPTLESLLLLLSPGLSASPSSTLKYQIITGFTF